MVPFNLYISLLAVFCSPSVGSAQAAVSRRLYDRVVPDKVLATFKTLPAPASIRYPQYTDTTAGKWILFGPDTWTSGFFPATLYALNERKTVCPATAANGLAQADWLNLGRSISTGLIPLTIKTGVGHDLGFLSFPFVDEYDLYPSNETAKTIINKFATNLAKRFNPVVGLTRSWGEDPEVRFQVIIDNMINLEVLYVSSYITNNATLRDIAVRHADTTIANHIREDGGTWHVVEYDANTGNVTAKHTAQGYADSSTWSRGQAWAIYGYANMYRRAGAQRYLDTARRLATYFLTNMPTNGIVPWDFNAPVAGRPADSSAAMVAANGLLMLAKLEPSLVNRAKWTNAAIQLVNNMTALAWNPSYQSILSNGTVNRPAGNSLTGTVYGDYYFIKAGTEFVRQGLATCG